MTGNIAKFETLGMLDGPGIRTVVFMQGCPLRCAYCHNPAFLPVEGGVPYTPEQLLHKILRYQTYYGSTGGVTVSGGEPLMQTAFLTEFFTLCKSKGIHTCLDTSGVGVGDYAKLLSVTDLVILDIKHTTEEGFRELTLASKSKTKPFWNALNESQVDVWIRQVIIPSYNDNFAYLKSLLNEILFFKNVKKVEFLPYHTMAVGLYDELNMQNRFQNLKAMDNKKAMLLQQDFIAMYAPFNPNLMNEKSAT